MRRITRVPYYIWYSKHEFTHILMGLLFAWFLREAWGEFSIRYVFIAIIGSLIIDIDHLLYCFIYGGHEQYAVEARKFLRQGQIGTMLRFWGDNHKHNIGLASHNIYVLGFLLSLSLVSWHFDWKVSVIFFGANVLHLCFDVVDDFWVLGKLNENWKHLRRRKTATIHTHSKLQ